MAFVPPMSPLVDPVGDDASASILVGIANPTPTTPTSGDATFAEVETVAPTFADRLALFPTFADVDAYIPPAPAVTSLDVYRREGSTGSGIRIAAGISPGELFTDWTPASGVDYSYRATAYAASNGTSTVGSWRSGAAGTGSGYTDTYQGSYT